MIAAPSTGAQGFLAEKGGGSEGWERGRRAPAASVGLDLGRGTPQTGEWRQRQKQLPGFSPACHLSALFLPPASTGLHRSCKLGKGKTRLLCFSFPGRKPTTLMNRTSHTSYCKPA